MESVTLDHIRTALAWARRGGGALDGHSRKYRQGAWSRGNACCVWSAAHLLATGRHATAGPSLEWINADSRHGNVATALSATDAADALPMLEQALSSSEMVVSSGSEVIAKSGSEVIAKSGSEVVAWSGSRVIAKSGSQVIAEYGSKVFALSGSEVFALSGSKVVAESGSRVVHF